MSRERPIRHRVLRLLPALLLALAPLSMLLPVQVARAAASTSTIRLAVKSARTEPNNPNGPVTKGDPITSYKFIINEDNVGDPYQARAAGCSPSDSSYPASCNWPSIQAMRGDAPIVTQGSEADLNNLDGLTLPAGKYLISVLADGYKLDAQWFTLPMAENFATPGAGLVTVEAQPLPLPSATMKLQVFEDNGPVNGAPDVPAEDNLAGFSGHIADVLGEVTNDVFGNPICTEYLLGGDGKPDPTQPIAGTGGQCLSDANGVVTIPNIGPGRYTATVVPPNGTDWVQTTTLEGNHDYDTWVQEGSTGYDTEFSIAGEPFPQTIFGFIHPTPLTGTATGSIKGSVWGVKIFIPPTGGLAFNGTDSGGYNGVKEEKPIDRPWIALSDLNGGDRMIYAARGNVDGTFLINNVPDGDYSLTYWDDEQNYILDFANVSVKNGAQTNLDGADPLNPTRLHMAGWWTTITGKICSDTNLNGKCDPGEQGIPGMPIGVKRRTNSVMDRGTTGVFTDSSGNYVMANTYPMTQWLIQEVYFDRFKTVGVTFQADNQDNETTILSAGVDLNILPIIGLSGRVDWALAPYTAGENGGIVGTVSYDTTRNELDPRFGAVEGWQPGIPNLDVNLYPSIPCTAGDADCQLVNTGLRSVYVKVNPATGTIAKGPRVNTYVTESWQRPQGCVARGVDNTPIPLTYQGTHLVLPDDPQGTKECLEGPLQGTQFGLYPQPDGSKDFASQVDGNYGFGDACIISLNPTVWGQLNSAGDGCANGTLQPLPSNTDYLVEVVVPQDSFGKPTYKVTREEDINIFSGDQYVPQALPLPACAGDLHTVDVAGIDAAGNLATLPDGSPNPAFLGDGPNATVNPDFAGGGGTIFEGQSRPLCDTKLVTLRDRRSIAPTFNFFTDVPLPGRFFGLIIDDLNLSINPQDLWFGEKAGIPLPVGIYDFTNRLMTTVQADPNGVYEVLMPSTSTINCPSPSGVCTSAYRMVGNDPGIPGRLNSSYNPGYRTIAATFEMFPGDILLSDLAPTQIGVTIESPGSTTTAAANCSVSGDTPQLFRISSPVLASSATARTLTLTGVGFGSAAGQVTLGTAAVPTNTWNDRSITFTVPSGLTAGTYRIGIKGANGKQAVNGVTLHLTGSGYSPTLFEVGPGKAYAKIQDAIDAATNVAQALIVVYPGGVPDSSNPSYNPQLAYFENLIVRSPLKLQGVGPGGVYPDNSVVEGSLIDGAAFGGDTALADAWRTKIAGIALPPGYPTVGEGATVTYLAGNANAYSGSYAAAIDGFSIQGGNQQGFPNNINVIGGTPTGLPAAVETQGGGIYAVANIRNLQVTNNILQSNGGAYGGAIRSGTPNLPSNNPFKSAQNDNLKVLGNRIINNGGTNLAGAIGLFNGTNGYEIGGNDLCGNFSAEYGGAIGHYGLSPNGKIHDNRIYFNRSYDEGGAIMVAGELPANTLTTLSPGAGPVDIYNNLVEANLANDDGGGIRLLMAGNNQYNIYNNMLVNNISTHEGGGIALDDAPNVRFYNNTVIKNITTATAATSDGSPAPAGLSTGTNSVLLQASLPPGSPTFSKPVLFNNIFRDNRAGRNGGNNVIGIGIPGDPNPINLWDLGVTGAAGGMLDITKSMLDVTTGTVSSATNQIGADPKVVSTYDVGITVLPWRNGPTNMTQTTLVAVNTPITSNGNYHIQAGSPAINAGAASLGSIVAPLFDIDNAGRPAGGGYDIGADEFGTAGLPGTRPFPATAVLDDFGRGLQFGLNTRTPSWNKWRGNGFQIGSFFNTIFYYNTTAANEAQATSSGIAYWNNTSFGPNQEVYFTFKQVATSSNVTDQSLVLKLNGGLSVADGAGRTNSLIEVQYRAGKVLVKTYARTRSQQWVTHNGTGFSATFAAGDVFGARTLRDGTVTVYKNGVSIGSVNVTSGARPWSTTLASSGGWAGVWMVGARVSPANRVVRFDDFGGGTLQ